MVSLEFFVLQIFEGSWCKISLQRLFIFRVYSFIMTAEQVCKNPVPQDLNIGDSKQCLINDLNSVFKDKYEFIEKLC